MPKKNIPLLKRLRTRFLRMRHKKHFNMDTVASRNDCGTAMCIAGHALDLEGYKVYFGGKYDAPKWVDPKGRSVIGPMTRAATLLGMNYNTGDREGYHLFHDFSLKTPKQAAARIEQLITEAEAAQ